jgi:hypothetical protein
VRVDRGRPQRAHQRRQRFHRDPHHDRLAVRHAALETAGPVRAAAERGVVELELVVHLGAAAGGVRERVAELDALHGLDRERGGAEPRVEAQPRLGVRAEAGRTAEDPHLDDAAERVLIALRVVDRGQHPGLGLRVEALELRVGAAREIGGGEVGPRRRSDIADPDEVAEHLDPQQREEILRDRADGDPGAGLARRGPLQHVADVVELVLHHAGQVGVAGSRHHHLAPAACSHLLELLLADLPGAHRRAPVDVVAVGDDQRHRPAERAAVPHAAQDLGRVLLDPLPWRAAVAGLAAGEVALHPVAVDGEPGGHAGHDRDDAGPVRLPAGDELEVHLGATVPEEPRPSPQRTRR